MTDEATPVPSVDPEYQPHPNPLSSAPPAYMDTIREGLKFVVFGTLGQIAFGLLAAIVGIGAGFLGPTVSNIVGLVASLIGAAIAALVLMGWMKFSEPDEGLSGEHDGAKPRQMIRLAVAIFAGVLVLNVLAAILAFVGLGIVALPVAVLVILATAFMLYAAMGYMKWMATRIPSAEIFKSAKLYSWLLPVLYFPGCALIVAPLVGLVLYLLLLFKVKESLEQISGA